MMSKKHYYYFKLSADFFKRLVIKKMKMMPGGGDLLSTYIALIAYSTQEEGVLVYQRVESTLYKELAMALECDEKITQSLLIFLEAHNLLEQIDDTRFLLVDSVKMIGSETDAAERMRRLREERKDPSLPTKKKESGAPLSGAERVKKCRENKKRLLLMQSSSVTDVTNESNECNDRSVTCNEIGMLQCNEDVTPTSLHDTAQTPYLLNGVTERTMFAQNEVTFAQSSTDIDIELERERGEYACTYTSAKEDIAKIPVDSGANATLHGVTNVTLETSSIEASMMEKYISFRLSADNIETPFAFEASLKKNIANKDGDEYRRFLEWQKLTKERTASLEKLVTQFVEFGYGDRYKCREIVNEGKNYLAFLGISDVSAMLFEIAFYESCQIIDERRRIHSMTREREAI